MTTLNEAARQALEYIEANADSKDEWDIVAALRQALEQPADEQCGCPKQGFCGAGKRCQEQPADEPVANASTWFALVMNAAAELEDASHCLRDEDAKRAAISGAKHYRDAAKALYTRPQPAAQWVEVECPLCGDMAVAHTQLPWHLNLSKSNKSGDEK